MALEPTINKDEFVEAMQQRFVEGAQYWGGKPVCVSPGVQAQKVPDNQRGACDMPLLHEINGIYQAWEFKGWKDECRAISQTCYIGDWTYLAKFSVKGAPEAITAYLKAKFINKFDVFEVGHEKHVFSTNEDGKLIMEGIAFKLAEDEILLTGGLAMNADSLAAGELAVEVEDVTAQQYCYHVQGPNSRKVLQKVLGEDISDIKFTWFRNCTLNGHEVRIFRGGMSGELGYEVHGDSAFGSADWEAIVEAGQEFGIEQLGYRSMPFNHLEAYFPTQWVDYIPASFPAPNDFVQNNLFHNPIEYHWGGRIDFEREFVGREALLAEKENPTRVGVMLEWNSEDVMKIFASLFDDEEDSIDLPPLPVARTHTYDEFLLPVLSQDFQFIGICTNRGYSVRTKKFVSLTQIDAAYAEPGTQVQVKYGAEGKRQIMLRATVLPVPYKPDNKFPKA